MGEGGGRWAAIRLNNQLKHLVIRRRIRVAKSTKIIIQEECIKFSYFENDKYY
jgi:hypothetical protein